MILKSVCIKVWYLLKKLSGQVSMKHLYTGRERFYDDKLFEITRATSNNDDDIQVFSRKPRTEFFIYYYYFKFSRALSF